MSRTRRYTIKYCDLFRTNLGKQSDTVDPSGLGEIPDRTQPPSLDVLAIHLTVPKSLSRQRNKCITFSFKYIRKAICVEEVARKSMRVTFRLLKAGSS